MMDPFIKTFTASQIRGALLGSAVCSPLVSFRTNLRCQSLTLPRAVTDGVLTTVIIALVVAWGADFVFRAGMRRNPWFRLEDHPLGEAGGIIMELLPNSFTCIGIIFALAGGALCAFLLYLIYTVAGIETLAFGTFIIFKLLYPALVGAVTARYAALNNFRFR